jgi:acyl transferase domain-containing protein/phosphopantetheinyl transferase
VIDADLAAEPIAVVGLGCVFPGASDVAQFWDNVVAGRDAITDVPADRIDPDLLPTLGRDRAVLRGGFVPSDALTFEPGRFGIMPNAAEWAEPDQLIALQCAAEALDDAGVLDDVAHERIGVILGRGGHVSPGTARIEQRVRTTQQLVTCLETLLPDLDPEQLAEVRDAFAAVLGTPSPDAVIGLVPNLAASRIANRLDLGGPAFTIDAACASTLVATDLAISELRAGRCDALLVGGVHHAHEVTFWWVFAQLGALSSSGAIRPFSAHADGLLIGEGTGVLVLERLTDARRFGHRVYATLLGSGVSSDGRDRSLMSPRTDGQVLALERAYAATQVDAAQVELVEGHGTATVAGDRAELDTLRRVFGKPDDRAGGVLGSVKSAIGHAMPAAGAAGLIKTVLAVHHGVLPATLGAEEPHPLVGETRFRLLSSAEAWRASLTDRLAGVNAFGFGGINAHVIVSGHGADAAVPTRASSAPSRLRADSADAPSSAVFLAGEDAADLGAQLRAYEPGSTVDPVLPSGGPARLAIVDPTPRSLELASRILETEKAWRGRNDLWFAPRGLLTEGGRLAFLFPGLEPGFAADTAAVARWFGREENRLPEGIGPIEQQGREVFMLGWLLNDVLGELRIHPDDIAGHSLGEWVAWFAADMVDPDRANEFLDTLQPGSLEVPGIAYLALGCGIEVAETLMSGIADVTLSHDNCPHQSVLCGPPDAIARVAERAASQRVLAQELPFRSGFHSPAFEPHLGVMRGNWERMPLQRPRVPLWSATTCEPYPEDADEVRALAVKHLLEAVRFRELLLRLYDEGSRVFVQVGAGSLAGFAEDTLRDRPHLAIAASSAKRSGVSQLLRVAAAVWVEGADVDVQPLLAPAREDRAAARRGPSIALRLDVPLVRLPRELTLASPTRATAGATPGPLGAQHDALLADTVAASDAVLAAFEGSSQTAASVATGEPDERTEPLRISLDDQPWLVDHCFMRQAPGWPDDSDRFPVMPLTGIIEIFVDAAVRMAPGKTVSRLEGVRAQRWLRAAPPTDAVLRATRVATDRVDLMIEGYARATAVLADRLPPAPSPAFEPLRDPAPSPRDPVAMYREHWMFHGALFQGVRHFDGLGEHGIDGEFEVLPTPGVALDNAAQIYGWWVTARADRNFLALPYALERLEFFGPLPVGARIATRVRVLECDERNVRADIELVHEGLVAVRAIGWAGRRFDSDPQSWQVALEPESRILSTMTPHGFAVVDERWRDGASREFLAYRYLGAEERAEYEASNPRKQRLRLLGRVAVKDAVRAALWADGHGELFPAEIPVANDARGKPYVASGPGAGLPVSISHAEWVGVALVGEPGGPPVGIDVELIAPRGETATTTVLSPAERELLDAAYGPTRPEEALTRAWAAKEAVAKAAGTGFEGRPKDFVISHVDAQRLLVSGRWVTTEVVSAPAQLTWDPRLVLNTIPAVKEAEQKRYVIAWTDRA